MNNMDFLAPTTTPMFSFAGLNPSPFHFGPLDTFGFASGYDENEETITTSIKKRKRLSLEEPSDSIRPEEAEDPSPINLKKVKAPSAHKKDIFKSWLRMKQKGRTNPAIEEEVRTLQPEDLYGHFLDFLPEDLEAFDEQIRFERTCAEDALQKAEPNSWLLRRSSYNRHWRGRLIGSPPPSEEDGDEQEEEEVIVNVNGEEDEDEELEDIDPDAQVRPSFFAFSYKREKSLLEEGQREIGHLLIVYTRLNGWALAEEDRTAVMEGGGTKIFCRHFFPSFIGLLAHTLERVGVHPTRMVSYDVPAPALALVEDEDP